MRELFPPASIVVVTYNNHESPDASGTRVLRGGAWLGDRDFARAAYRDGPSPDSWYYDIGFRFGASSSLKF